MQNEPIITHAEPENLPRIMEIIHLCTEDLRKRNLETWSEEYPTEEMIANDITAGRVFIALFQYPTRKSPVIAGTVTLTKEIEEDSQSPVAWLKNTEKFIGIARLGVDPVYHGMGIGRTLFNYADKLAERMGFLSIRLYVLSKADQLTAMYKRRGYTCLGSVSFEGRAYDVMERPVPNTLLELIQPRSTPDVHTQEAVHTCQDIRRKVFTEEQKVDWSIDLDGNDLIYEHLLLYRGSEAAGCLRLNTSKPRIIKLERLAVLPQFRGLGFGKKLVDYAVKTAKIRNAASVVMHAQYHLLDYYKTLGFTNTGEAFFEANIKHTKMELHL
ncbi:MAG: GNAT family N-acetyltransferase [Spirochaetales bacterium]|jgi:predicted GNAT family N-acyltransferase|nr:GNAT family N-acetyltransferase [Spirochaetales bacterium]